MWQAGLEAQVGALMSPGAPTGGGPQAAPPLARPSVGAAAASATERRANRTFLHHMVGIVIKDRSGGVTDHPGARPVTAPSVWCARLTRAGFPVGLELRKQAVFSLSKSRGCCRQGRRARSCAAAA